MRKCGLIVMIFLLIGVGESYAQTKNDMIFWGIFEEGIQSNLNVVNNYGSQLGKKPSMVMWYVQWQTTGDHSFPLATCQQLDAAGYMPDITWEPWCGLDDIISGKFDSDLQKFGQDIATFGKPVMLRFGHEFNGDWYPWNYINGAAVPAATWVTAYKYVHDKIVDAGGTNAKWVWCPNNGNGGNNPQDILSYYPGDDYVDWLGIDGYNWGTSQSWSSWSSFSSVFGTAYQKLITKAPGKPMMLGEMGCTSTGGDKAAWIKDMFSQLENKYTHIKAFVWFNVNKETDWRFTADTASTNAFALGLSDNTIKYDINQLGGISNISTSIGEIKNNSVMELYPNPVGLGENLTFRLSGNYAMAEVRISDLNGRIIYSQKLGNSESVFNTSKLGVNGVYNIQVVNNESSISRMLIVQ
jgi:hypothetical protein